MQCSDGAGGAGGEPINWFSCSTFGSAIALYADAILSCRLSLELTTACHRVSHIHCAHGVLLMFSPAPSTVLCSYSWSDA